MPDNADFAYTAEDLKTFIKKEDVKTFILINPDNPTGNYLSHTDVLGLIEWCGQEGVNIIADESFADFADEQENTLIAEAILNRFPNLIVMKSISKSYGVPGLRLGVLASSDEKLIAELKKDVAIWNINSYAEFYMQISEKYRKDYETSLEKMRGERVYLKGELEKINGLRVVPSQANYLLVELTGKKTAKELTKVLLLKYNLLIKDLSAKISTGEYVRLAVRNREDNDRLLAALQSELG
jgi:histidinol-phosphate/aromatic aminotransferase/cobyric acid decarboxylase-like protein